MSTRRRFPQGLIFLLGLVVLAFASEPLKDVLGRPIAFAVQLLYVVSLGIAARRFGR
jgi:hypothetical protein